MAAAVAWVGPPLCFLSRGIDAGLPFCGEEPARWSAHHIREAGLTVHVYRPDRPVSTTLVLVPGLHPDGIGDPRLRSFAAAAAQAGFQVVAADVEEFRTFHIEAGVVDRLSRLVLALPHHLPTASLANVGLFGISYAGGPVLVTAARPEVAERLHFVGAFGAYHDLVNAMEFALEGGDCGGRPLPPPHQWGRMIFVAQDASTFLPEPQARAVSEALRLRLALRVDEARAREAALPESARAFLRSVLDGPEGPEVERFRSALPRYAELSRRLSPSQVAARIDPRLRIYLLHGRGDDVIPYCETEELQRALRAAGHPQVRALISTAFRHVDPRATAGGGLRVWRERLELLAWTRRILAEAGR